MSPQLRVRHGANPEFALCVGGAGWSGGHGEGAVVSAGVDYSGKCCVPGGGRQRPVSSAASPCPLRPFHHGVVVDLPRLVLVVSSGLEEDWVWSSAVCVMRRSCMLKQKRGIPAFFLRAVLVKEKVQGSIQGLF